MCVVYHSVSWWPTVDVLCAGVPPVVGVARLLMYPLNTLYSLLSSIRHTGCGAHGNAAEVVLEWVNVV